MNLIWTPWLKVSLLFGQEVNGWTLHGVVINHILYGQLQKGHTKFFGIYEGRGNNDNQDTSQES